MDQYFGFIRTNGRTLEDENGKKYLLKGMAFGNNVWANPDIAPFGLHHNEDSYRELAELGFNSVRFYINYGILENDNEPYKYKESGFQWLDTNIEWGKKYGIRIVLNMHFPQGGYQSHGNGMELWTKPENQERLIAMWKEIARRYADEPFIAGYGLLNEPIVPTYDADCGTKLWQDLTNRMIKAIRLVDQSHIIFVESIQAYQDPENGMIDWMIKNNENNFAIAEDEANNLVYEFHFYSPYNFTHQGLEWTNAVSYDRKYPNEMEIMANGVSWRTGSFCGQQCDVESNDWQYLISSRVAVTSDNQVLSYVFQAQNIGEDGRVYLDDVSIEEYDSEGNKTRIIYADAFTETCPMNFWANNNVGSGTFIKTKGRVEGGSYRVEGTTDDASGSVGFFRPVKGFEYQATGYFRVKKANDEATIRPRVDIWEAESIYSFDKEYIRSNIMPYVEFSKKYNVPVYCGEFGSDAISFENDRGGSEWVSDVIDIFEEYDISYNYHTYHEESFGLYLDNSMDSASTKNLHLFKLFAKKLKN